MTANMSVVSRINQLRGVSPQVVEADEGTKLNCNIDEESN